MNKKGFTLIELLAVIVVLGVVLLLAMPSILDSINTSRDSSYKILIGNIKTAAETYYQECEYGDLSDKNKYGEDYACTITNGNTINTTIGALANTGILKVSESDENNKLVVLDPRDNKKNLNDCKITITKEKKDITDNNGITSSKVMYEVKGSTQDGCPTDEDLQ